MKEDGKALKDEEVNSRKIALALLLRADANKSYVNIALDRGIADIESEKIRFAVTARVYGTVERRITLDYIIATLAKRSIADMNPHTLWLLRLGIYELAYMADAQEYAAVNECVKLSSSLGERSFVNAILRSCIRERDSMAFPTSERDEVRYLSVKHSFPRGVCRFFIDSFGFDAAEACLEYFNSSTHTVLRVNTLRTTRAELMGKIAGAREGKLSDNAIIADGAVARMYGYGEGLFTVQDESSQVACEVLAPSAGMIVVDVCSAPGGKSMSMAMLMNNSGVIYSYDIHKSKLSLIEHSAERLGIDIVRVAERDGTLPPDTDMLGIADRVMCDVPCSGLGVLGKKADMRYRDMDSIAELPALQRAILDSAVKYLKVGGELVYSTCTLNRRENEDVVDAFLADNPEYEYVPFEVADTECDGSFTFMPAVHGCDGFFVSKIVRRK